MQRKISENKPDRHIIIGLDADVDVSVDGRVELNVDVDVSVDDRVELTVDVDVSIDGRVELTVDVTFVVVLVVIS